MKQVYQHDQDREYALSDMRYELDEIDAQVEELQALYTAEVLASGGKGRAELYDEELEDIRNEIGVLLEELNDSNVESVRDEHSFLHRVREELTHVRSTFASLRRRFLYRY